MKEKVWNFWAAKYDKLWVQKYSLKPTRDYILEAVSQNINRKSKILDLGCGPGELIRELFNKYEDVDITGVDFSEGMLQVSKSRNPKAKHIKMDVSKLHKINEKFDLIICTHSLPYYKEPKKVMKELNRLLNDEGKVFIGFASGNSFYDKFILSFVKLTTGPANYPSDIKFRKLIRPYFTVENIKIIKEKKYMPRIAIYTLKKELS